MGVVIVKGEEAVLGVNLERPVVTNVRKCVNVWNVQWGRARDGCNKWGYTCLWGDFRHWFEGRIFKHTELWSPRVSTGEPQ